MDFEYQAKKSRFHSVVGNQKLYEQGNNNMQVVVLNSRRQQVGLSGEGKSLRMFLD